QPLLTPGFVEFAPLWFCGFCLQAHHENLGGCNIVPLSAINETRERYYHYQAPSVPTAGVGGNGYCEGDSNPGHRKSSCRSSALCAPRARAAPLAFPEYTPAWLPGFLNGKERLVRGFVTKEEGGGVGCEGGRLV